MNKIKIYLLYICTFGTIYFYLKHKANKFKNVDKKELTLSEIIPIDVEKLIINLGGIDNIESCSNTISSIKIVVKDISIVDINQIKKTGVKGIMKGKDYISFLFGDFSNSLKNEIINKKNIS